MRAARHVRTMDRKRRRCSKACREDMHKTSDSDAGRSAPGSIVGRTLVEISAQFVIALNGLVGGAGKPVRFLDRALHPFLLAALAHTAARDVSGINSCRGPLDNSLARL